MPANEHDTLARRLTQILFKLNQGEQLDPRDLALEFGVAQRTIQRDLNERFAYLPLVKAEGRYQLDPAYLGKLRFRDLERFAGLAGVRGLFPSLTDDFLREVLDSRLQTALLVKGHQYEDLGSRKRVFQEVEHAILARCHISFEYRKTEGVKSYVGIEPYRLVNHGGIWYLAGKHEGRLKAFSFGKIERLLVSSDESAFTRDLEDERRSVEQDGIWLNEHKTEVVLKVAAEVAGYFRRRKLVADQKIVNDLEDGSLIVSTTMVHPNQLLPTVRYWIPHVRIVSPEGLQREMENEVREYLRSCVESSR